jgi:hypothetical protein
VPVLIPTWRATSRTLVCEYPFVAIRWAHAAVS